MPSPQQKAAGRFAVASGTPSLLVVLLKTARQPIVDHPTHVRLIHAHAEGRGRHDYVKRAVEKRVLHVDFEPFIHPGVEMFRIDARGFQHFGQFLGAGAGRAVDDTAFTAMREGIGGDDIVALGFGMNLPAPEIQVRTVETRHDPKRVMQPQITHDAVAYVGRGRCGERGDDRAFGKSIHERGDAEIIRAEILPPLEYAMRLIHSQQTDPDRLREAEKTLRGQAFRSDIQQADTPFTRRRVDFSTPILRGFRVDERGGNTMPGQMGHLIAHQRTQRRDDQHQRGNAVPARCTGRNLIAQRFARTRRHHGKHITMPQNRRDDIQLPATERIVPITLLQRA